MNLDPLLLELIACPNCLQPLTVDDPANELVCQGCHYAYPVRGDIPILLLDEARKPA